MNEIIEHLKDKKVRENLELTTRLKQAASFFLEEQGFIEYSTPILMPRTGERYNSTFEIMLEEIPAMLADSPQLYKLILAHAGYEKYYQIARCFRVISKESGLQARLSEFTQIDLEFQNAELSQLIQLAQKLIEHLCNVVHKESRFIYMSGLECRKHFGEDMKPTLRSKDEQVSVIIVEKMPLMTEENTPNHHIFALPSEKIANFDKQALRNVTTESFDIVINGIEVGGGDLRIMDSCLQHQMMKLFGVNVSCYKDYLKMLEQSGTNQGGGFAIGLERLVMALTDCETIHQTVAFPDYYKREHF